MNLHTHGQRAWNIENFNILLYARSMGNISELHNIHIEIIMEYILTRYNGKIAMSNNWLASYRFHENTKNIICARTKYI